ncbi:MAG: hypothetical protein ACJ79Y_03880, partial [Myxococcales bacterium]
MHVHIAVVNLNDQVKVDDTSSPLLDCVVLPSTRRAGRCSDATVPFPGSERKTSSPPSSSA